MRFCGTRRDRCLREQGFKDCFRAVKASETAFAISFLPQLLKCALLRRTLRPPYHRHTTSNETESAVATLRCTHSQADGAAIVRCREIDDIADLRERYETVVRGVVAGNIFDLGAAAGADLFNSGKVCLVTSSVASQSATSC